MADVLRTGFSLDDSDVSRAADLRRVKALAAAVLVACLALLVLAKAMAGRHPAWGFVAAFAEAAAIGGLADWYAVVALFRRPMGLPIPHTAIIPSNQHKIAEKLGKFIEEHFLDAAPVEAKLREVDFASFVADWLQDQKRSLDLSRFVLRLLPEAIEAADNSGLKSYAVRRIMAQLQNIDLAPLASGALRGFIAQGRHRVLLDDLMVAAHSSLNEPQTMAAIGEKIRAELPTLLRLYRADKFLLKKVAASATSFFDDVRNDPQHPFRGEFDRILLSFVDKLESEPAYASRLDMLKRDLLSRPELSDLAQTIWANVRLFIERNARGETDVLERHLSKMFMETGAQLASDPQLRGEINTGVVTVLKSFIASQKSGVSTFIADQVKGWDMTQLITLIEVNVGRDLQYIRFNGTLIGGLAGLALHAIEVLVRGM